MQWSVQSSDAMHDLIRTGAIVLPPVRPLADGWQAEATVRAAFFRLLTGLAGENVFAFYGLLVDAKRSLRRGPILPPEIIANEDVCVVAWRVFVSAKPPSWRRRYRAFRRRLLKFATRWVVLQPSLSPGGPPSVCIRPPIDYPEASAN